MTLSRACPRPTQRCGAIHCRCPSGPRWSRRRVARSNTCGSIGSRRETSATIPHIARGLTMEGAAVHSVFAGLRPVHRRVRTAGHSASNLPSACCGDEGRRRQRLVSEGRRAGRRAGRVAGGANAGPPPSSAATGAARAATSSRSTCASSASRLRADTARRGRFRADLPEERRSFRSLAPVRDPARAVTPALPVPRASLSTGALFGAGSAARRPCREQTEEMAKDTQGAMSPPGTGEREQRSPGLETIRAALRSEMAVVFGAITTALFYAFSDALLSDLLPDVWSIVLFIWLFGTMLWCAFGVVRHADCLAELVGEPYGTLILTLAVISIEVSLISSIMLHGANEPTLARDTMFAVLMIILNGMVGLALLVGGPRHREQHYNLQGAKAFLAVIIPLAVLTMTLPRFLSSPRAAFSPLQAAFFAAMTIGLYGVFLSVQTVRHRNLFKDPGARRRNPVAVPEPLTHDEPSHRHGEHAIHSVPFHVALLMLAALPVLLLSKKLAVFVDYGMETLGAPVELGGIIIAILVLAPEGLGALRAALANRLQRSVNILLGSALATIGLTIPVVLMVGLIINVDVELGLDQVEMVLLLVTLTVSALTFTGGRTNILQGAVHLVLFFAFLLLIFKP